jgi:hypothetical protein
MKLESHILETYAPKLIPVGGDNFHHLVALKPVHSFTEEARDARTDGASQSCIHITSLAHRTHTVFAMTRMQ